MKQDLFSTEKLHPDFTIVYLHWGTEYERFPNEDQRALAKMCFDNGADFVAGSNPHVLQKAEEMQFYSYGTLKKGFVAYTFEKDGKSYGSKVKVPSRGVMDIISVSALLIINAYETIESL